MPYPTSFCSFCPLSLLSPHKPSSWDHQAHHTLCRALTHMESQPFPSPGKGLSRGSREGATTQLPHSLACLCIPPKPLSSLSLLPAYAIFQGSKFVRSVSHCVGEDVVSLLSDAKTCCNPTLQQKELSSSPALKFILCNLERGSPRTCHFPSLALLYTNFWSGSSFLKRKKQHF